MERESAVAEFWSRCRGVVADLPEELPESWAFGATPEQADRLLDLVLAGRKTATASALWDYEENGDRLPEVGDLSIVLDGCAAPRAVVETTLVKVVPFDEVSEEHAFAEGEGDRTLFSWRSAHERFWREHSQNPRGFEPDMPVVCEEMRLVFP